MLKLRYFFVVSFVRITSNCLKVLKVLLRGESSHKVSLYDLVELYLDLFHLI